MMKIGVEKKIDRDKEYNTTNGQQMMRGVEKKSDKQRQGHYTTHGQQMMKGMEKEREGGTTHGQL